MQAESSLPSDAYNSLRVVEQPRAHSFRATYLPAAAVVLAAFLYHLATVRIPLFPVDDAYITLHNAQVLHWGHDPNFVGTPALAGATSPFHLALVAALMFVLKPLWALDVAAWLGALAFALGIVRLALAQSVPPGPTFMLVVAGLLAARTPHQLMNGLETGWAMAGVTWALAFASEESAASGFALAAICGTLPFLRPELTALSAMLLPIPAWRACPLWLGWKRSGAQSRTTEPLRIVDCTADQKTEWGLSAGQSLKDFHQDRESANRTCNQLRFANW